MSEPIGPASSYRPGVMAAQPRLNPQPLRAIATTPKEGWAHRTPRPLIMCAAAVGVIACVAFAAMVAVMLLLGLNRWAHGQPIDFMGFAAVIGSLGTLLAGIIGIAGPIFNARHYERQSQIAAGQSVGPFSPSGVTDGPRPGDTP